MSGYKRTLKPGDPRHGTMNAYVNWACRCDACKEAQRRHYLEHRKPQRLDPWDERHGTVNGYTNYGCRCSRCKDASRVARRQRRTYKRRTAVAS